MNAILKETNQTPTSPAPLTAFADLDRDLQLLAGNRQRWVQTSVAERITILNEIKDALMPVAQAWAETAGRKKSPFLGLAIGVIPCTGNHITVAVPIHITGAGNGMPELCII